MERIEIPESMKRIRFRFPDAPHSGRIVLSVEELGKRYGENGVLTGVTFLLERGRKLVVVGRNGAGKSTLMRIIAGVDADHTGVVRLGAGVRVGYFSQDIDTLPASGSVLDAAADGAETSDSPRLRDLLGAFLFRGDDVYKPVAVLSGGERSRLALLRLLLRPTNLLVLDEPTNHLDMTSKNVLLDALKAYSGTVVFVSHDRYFIEEIADGVLELEGGRWRLFPGDYAYYLWKTAGDASPNEPSGVESKNRGNAAPRRAGENAGIERALEKRLRSRLRTLQRREEALLVRLDEIETERADCEQDLARKENYTNGSTVRDLTRKLDRLDREREDLNRGWVGIESESAEIRAQLAVARRRG